MPDSDPDLPLHRYVPMYPETFRDIVAQALLHAFNPEIRRHYFVEDWHRFERADQYLLWLSRNSRSLLGQTVEPGHVRLGVIRHTPLSLTVGVESRTGDVWRHNGTLTFTQDEWQRLMAENRVIEFLPNDQDDSDSSQ